MGKTRITQHFYGAILPGAGNKRVNTAREKYLQISTLRAVWLMRSILCWVSHDHARRY